MQPKADHTPTGTARPGSTHLGAAEQCPSKHHKRTEHEKAKSELESEQKSDSQTITYFFMQSVRENKTQICFSKKNLKIIIFERKCFH